METPWYESLDNPPRVPKSCCVTNDKGEPTNLEECQRGGGEDSMKYINEMVRCFFFLLGFEGGKGEEGFFMPLCSAESKLSITALVSTKCGLWAEKLVVGELRRFLFL